jgi:hypothetical protein
MRYWLPFGTKTIAACLLPHPEHEHQWSANDYWSCISANLSVAIWYQFYLMSWQPVHLTQCMTYMLSHPETEHQQSIINIGCCILGLSRLYADQWAQIRTIDYLYSQKYNIYQEKHGFQINQYCNLHSMQTCIIGYSKRNLNKILITSCNSKSIIWIDK